MGIFTKKSTTERINKLLNADRTQEAITLCQNICKKPQATAQDWVLYGQLSSEAGDLATARTAYYKATQLNPDLLEAQFALGKLLSAMGDYSQSVSRLEKAVLLQSENADIRLALGITFGLMNQFDKAEDSCRRSLEIKPGSANAHFNLANALQAQGKLSDACVEYEAALKYDPGMVTAWSMLAQARNGMQDFDAAEVAAKQAINLDPQSGEAYFTLGNIVNARGDNEQSWGYFERAAELLPDFPIAHICLGEALFKLNRYIRASDSFQMATSLDATNPQAHFMLGQCFERRKMRGRAENSYRKVLVLDPDHLQAHYCLAFINLHREHHDEAASHFNEILRLNPNDEQAKHLLDAQQGKTTSTAPKKYVSTLFDGFAGSFDQKLVNDLGYRIPEILFEAVNQELMSPAMDSLDIIDLGCGTGLCAPLFRPIARRLHGVDLSPRMIDKARERGLYDKLDVNDIVSSLKEAVADWDIVISADVFVYVGDLRETFESCKTALKPGGIFAFSVEDGNDANNYILRNSGRYAHSSAYIETLTADCGFSEICRHAVVIRKDKGEVNIDGHLFLLRSTNLTGWAS